MCFVPASTDELLGSTPSCRVAGACGGCPHITRSLAAQAELKLSRVRRALEQAFDESSFWRPDCRATFGITWVKSPTMLAYRNRVRMRIAQCGELGFFNDAKSFECPALAPSLRRAIVDLRAIMAESEGAFGEFAHVEVRMPGLDGRPSAYFVRRDAGCAVSARAHEAIAALGSCGWWVEVAGSFGDVHAAVVQRYPLRGLWWDVPLGTFMQINPAVNELLLEHAVLGACRRKLASFVDLFSGAGNFALPLATAGLDGAAVERDVRAVCAAQRSAAAQGLNHLRVLPGDAHGWAEMAVRLGRSYDLVVLDPPRAGLKGSSADFAALARSHVLLCSCSPTSLSSDLRALADAAFTVESVTAFDMFPGTEHVEVAVWLRREA